MKKYIITFAIVGLLIGGVAFAKTYDYTLSRDKVVNIYSDVLTLENINLAKVIDGTTTCYISYIKSPQGVTVSSSINCLK